MAIESFEQSNMSQDLYECLTELRSYIDLILQTQWSDEIILPYSLLLMPSQINSSHKKLFDALLGFLQANKFDQKIIAALGRYISIQFPGTASDQNTTGNNNSVQGVITISAVIKEIENNPKYVVQMEFCNMGFVTEGQLLEAILSQAQSLNDKNIIDLCARCVVDDRLSEARQYEEATLISISQLIGKNINTLPTADCVLGFQQTSPQALDLNQIIFPPQQNKGSYAQMQNPLNLQFENPGQDNNNQISSSSSSQPSQVSQQQEQKQSEDKQTEDSEKSEQSPQDNLGLK